MMTKHDVYLKLCLFWIMWLPQTSLFYAILTTSVTPQSRVLLVKLWGAQSINSGTFTSSLHDHLSCTRWVHSILPPPVSLWSVFILTSHLCLDLLIGHFPSGFAMQNLYSFLFSPICCMPCPCHPPLLDQCSYRKNAVFWDVTLMFWRNLAPPSSGWQESVN
jgi:hypothetical protein